MEMGSLSLLVSGQALWCGMKFDSRKSTFVHFIADSCILGQEMLF